MLRGCATILAMSRQSDRVQTQNPDKHGDCFWNDSHNFITSGAFYLTMCALVVALTGIFDEDKIPVKSAGVS